MAKQKGPDLSPHIDLHMHTHYGESCSLTKPEALAHHTVEQGRTAVGVADLNSVQAFPELEKAGQTYGIKILYGLETTMQNDVDAETGNPPLPAVTVLAKNKTGLNNLYRIVTRIKCADAEETFIKKSELTRYHEGLFFASTGSRGEVFQAVNANLPAEHVQRLAAFYDYFELMPVSEALPIKREQTEEIYRAVVLLAKTQEKPFIATSDARYLNREDRNAFQIAFEGKEEASVPFNRLYDQTTDSLLQEFYFLGIDDIKAAVINYPQMLADACESICVI